jgi:hypothetical protein
VKDALTQVPPNLMLPVLEDTCACLLGLLQDINEESIASGELVRVKERVTVRVRVRVRVSVRVIVRVRVRVTGYQE